MIETQNTQTSFSRRIRRWFVVPILKGTPMLCFASNAALQTKWRNFSSSSSLYHSSINSSRSNKLSLFRCPSTYCCPTLCQILEKGVGMRYGSSLGSHNLDRDKRSSKMTEKSNISKDPTRITSEGGYLSSNQRKVDQHTETSAETKSDPLNAQDFHTPSAPLHSKGVMQVHSDATTGRTFIDDLAHPSPIHRSPYFSSTQRLFVSWQQGLVASIGAVMGIGFIIFLLYAPVKEDTVHHTAVVASEALGDLRLRGRAIELSKDVVDNVLQDPKTLQLVVNIAVKLLAQEDIVIAISSLLQCLFDDHYTQEITKKFVLKTMRDPWITEQTHIIAKELFLRLIETKEIKQALVKLLTESTQKTLDNPALHHDAARAIRKSFIQAINPLQ